MKGCPVAFFSFAFCVKQIAFKLTPQLTQLTGALSVSDREPWSLEEHQAPALHNRQCHQERAWARQTALRALGVCGCLVTGRLGQTDRQQRSGQLQNTGLQHIPLLLRAAGLRCWEQGKGRSTTTGSSSNAEVQFLNLFLNHFKSAAT